MAVRAHRYGAGALADRAHLPAGRSRSRVHHRGDGLDQGHRPAGPAADGLQAARRPQALPQRAPRQLCVPGRHHRAGQQPGVRCPPREDARAGPDRRRTSHPAPQPGAPHGGPPAAARDRRRRRHAALPARLARDLPALRRRHPHAGAAALGALRRRGREDGQGHDQEAAHPLRQQPLRGPRTAETLRQPAGARAGPRRRRGGARPHSSRPRRHGQVRRAHAGLQPTCLRQR
mmetsp:Transcript_41533/g.104734  ORF Transcript_41533/g.104734 Transcript_41533/m.104734 type:complete len:232 (-) Transcript_41533:388-1083(-)